MREGPFGIPPETEGSRYGRWTWALYERFDCVNALARYPSGGWNRSLAAFEIAEKYADLTGNTPSSSSTESKADPSGALVC